MKPLDKKQIPQVVVLVVLAVALFGYFAMKMILPTPAAAGTQSVAPAAKPEAKTAPVASVVVPGTLTVPAPGAGMHDPFVQAVSDQVAPAASAALKPAPAVRPASLKVTGVAPLSIPAVPSLPAAGGDRGLVSVGLPGVVPPMPVAPVVPDWTVTGVLQSGTEHVAILRSGDTRRFVRQGEHVDSQFVVAAVTRDCVVLRHGDRRFTLPLGGAPKAPVSPAKADAPAGTVLDAFPALAPGVSVPDATKGQNAPHPKEPKEDDLSPLDVASLPAPHHIHQRGMAREAFALPAPGRSILARSPLAARHRAPCPTIKVAGYQSEMTAPQYPSADVRGLLPSGIEAPDFSLATLGGESFSLSQFRGNVVVLDFWASWYGPSARSLEPLAQMQKALGAQGLTVLAVNSWDNRVAMQAALQGGDGSTMQLYDPGVSNESVAVRLYHASDVPTFYVIDREGRVAGAFVGSGAGTIRNIQADLAKLGIVS